MIKKGTEQPFISTSFFEDAEMDLVSEIVEFEPIKNKKLQRLLASYPLAIESEKELIIVDLMESLWNAEEASNFFKVFRDFESVFAILGDKGHFIHQFEVFLLGWSILNTLYDRDHERIFESHYNNKISLFYNWLKASTAHDFGYPLQVINRLTKEFSQLYQSVYMENIALSFKLISNTNFTEEKNLFHVEIPCRHKGIKKHLDLEAFIINGIDQSIISDSIDASMLYRKLKTAKKPHAVISALIFAKAYITYLGEAGIWQEKGELYNETSIIAASIALHSIHSIDKSIIKYLSFNKNPIAYLLFIVDNLQEWNRSLRRNEKYPVFSLKAFKIDADQIKLTYQLDHHYWTIKIKNTAKEYIEGQRELFRKLQTPDPSFDIVVKIVFESNTVLDIKPIIIKL